MLKHVLILQEEEKSHPFSGAEFLSKGVFSVEQWSFDLALKSWGMGV